MKINVIRKKIKELKQQLLEVEEQERKLQSNLKFLCCCKKMHKIKECVVVQRYYETGGYSCYGGYTAEGELQIICPKTNVRNRVLFDDYDTPWEKRDHYDYNPQMQFKSNFKKLFKEIVDEYEKDKNYQWENNFYFDKNRKKFDINVKKDVV